MVKNRSRPSAKNLHLASDFLGGIIGPARSVAPAVPAYSLHNYLGCTLERDHHRNVQDIINVAGLRNVPGQPVEDDEIGLPYPIGTQKRHKDVSRNMERPLFQQGALPDDSTDNIDIFIRQASKTAPSFSNVAELLSEIKMNTPLAPQSARFQVLSQGCLAGTCGTQEQ